MTIFPSVCVGSRLGFVPKELISKPASMTGGLVGQSEHLILPSVPPVVTMILTLLSVLVRYLTTLTRLILGKQSIINRATGSLSVAQKLSFEWSHFRISPTDSNVLR